MKLVIDTNIVLDLFVFGDERAASLKAAIAGKEVQWLVTPAMRDELVAVLAYEQIGRRMAAAQVSPDQVLARFDEHAVVVEVPPAAALKCSDPDDQKFVDLAAAHGANLLSKDKALLALRRKMTVASTFAQ